MSPLELFPPNRRDGIFRGFSGGGLEFHADLVLPYRRELQSIPMHGQFVLVQLESDQEAVLGRITAVTSQGRLASPAGEDYGIRALDEGREVPEDLRDQYLKYQVDIRVLGVLRIGPEGLQFAPSHRRLPHVGAPVAFLTGDLLQEVAGHNDDGAVLGHLAFGEFVHAEGSEEFEPEPWMRVAGPAVRPRFAARSLVSRRTFVFARAGFGKSNLVKLLFSSLYSETPTVTKRGGRKVPVGTVLFDPDGEYFWPDDKGRPGFCDVPELRERLVVFTNRKGPSPFYDSFVAGGIKLDIRRLRPADVVGIALPPERQDQQNVAKLKAMNDRAWAELVDAVAENGHGTDLELVAQLLKLDPVRSEAEAIAARSNVTRIVQMLHDPSSQLMDMLLASLRAGRLCVVDVSQLRGAAALTLSGLILQRIFDHNQEQFTAAEPKTIPTIAVVEEAQSVLGAGGSGEGPYVTWVKEGRKYDLGAVLITQQPGSIPFEILSQGDNWFVFHLLSGGDLIAVKRANAHFSDDLLSSLLNEPIPGHCVFWSSARKWSFPLPVRVLSFEALHGPADPDYTSAAVATPASSLKERFERELTPPVAVEPVEDEEAQPVVDAYETLVQRAIAAVAADLGLIARIRRSGAPWMAVQAAIRDHLPEHLDRRDDAAYQTVPRALNEIFGRNGWTTERRPKKDGSGAQVTYVVTTVPAAPDDDELPF